MRFIKLTSKKLGKDILHIWVDDDCPPWIVRNMILDVIADNIFLKDYTLTDRQYKQTRNLRNGKSRRQSNV